jgi:hypothetical protein
MSIELHVKRSKKVKEVKKKKEKEKGCTTCIKNLVSAYTEDGHASCWIDCSSITLPPLR